MLLRGILAASQEKNNIVFWFPDNDRIALDVMKMAAHILQPLGVLFSDIRAHSRMIKFDNGSTLHFLGGSDQYVQERMLGVDYYKFTDDLT